MKINRIIYKDYHDPVYGSLDRHPYVADKLDNPPDFIQDMIGYARKNTFMTNLGLRVAAISSRHFEVMNKRMQTGHLVENLENHDMDTVLDRMKSCYPGGAEVDITTRFYCDKYAACPWCRFRKAVEIGKRLEPHLKKSGGLAVIRISSPDPFQYVSPDERADYKTLIRSICVKKSPKLFLYDAVVTVPNWYQNYFHQYGQHAQNQEWLFSRDTTIIGILPKGGGALPLPEDLVSQNAREKMGFCGAPSWRIYKPTTMNLRYALGYALRYSPGLLSPDIDPGEYVSCLMMQTHYRVAYHGFPRGRSSSSVNSAR